MWRRGSPPSGLVGMSLVQPLWRTARRFLKELKMELPCDLAIPLLGICHKKRGPKGYMHRSAPWSAVFCGQDMEATSLSIHRCTGKDDVGHTYNGVLFGHQKDKRNNAICSNTDGPGDCHTKWSKSVRERQILYDVADKHNLKNGTNELIYTA